MEVLFSAISLVLTGGAKEMSCHICQTCPPPPCKNNDRSTDSTSDHWGAAAASCAWIWEDLPTSPHSSVAQSVCGVRARAVMCLHRRRTGSRAGHHTERQPSRAPHREAAEPGTTQRSSRAGHHTERQPSRAPHREAAEPGTTQRGSRAGHHTERQPSRAPHREAVNKPAPRHCLCVLQANTTTTAPLTSEGDPLSPSSPSASSSWPGWPSLPGWGDVGPRAWATSECRRGE